MKAKVADIVSAVERLAPPEGAESYDNIGLLVGDAGAEVCRVLVALDVTMAVIEEAAEKQAQLIITHHPVIFSPMRAIRTDQPQGMRIAALLQKGIHVAAAHTNLDAASGGVPDALAQALGLCDCARHGFLLIGAFEKPMTLPAVCRLAAARLEGPMAPYAVGDAGRPVQRVALAVGQAEESALEEARALGADVLIAGDVKHHQLIDAGLCGLPVVVLGHGASELPVVELLSRGLQKALDALQYEVEVMRSTCRLL